MRITLFCVLILLAGCAKRTEEKSDTPKVRITQFYSPKPTIPKGEKGMLCYGVENAKSVRLDPPEVELTPSFTKCVEIDPKGPTKYTLIAEGAEGATDQQTVEVKTGGTRVSIKEIWVNSLAVKAGEKVQVCVTAPGAVTFEANPGTPIPDRSPAKGCIEDRPRQTTTYRVSVAGSAGDTDEGEVTVKVK
jgi:hypothetical protein